MAKFVLPSLRRPAEFCNVCCLRRDWWILWIKLLRELST